MGKKERGEKVEMETFLSPEEQVSANLLDDPRKVSIVPAGGKIYRENGVASSFDPFKNRLIPKPTTDSETLTHLLKACLGSGILAMPAAFKNAGVLFGTIGTLIVALICAHCAYILVKSAHKLYYVTKVSSLTFPDVGELAFANGPGLFKKFAIPIRMCIVIGIFLTYFSTCCAYSVIIAENMKQVIMQYGYFQGADLRWFIFALLPAVLLLSYIPDLKSLTICSQIANFLMACTIGITIYYISTGSPLHNPLDLPQIAPVQRLPDFFSITIFAMECIGVIMPLENNMETPQNFLGTFGVMNQGMFAVTIIYLLLGLFGYLKYGENVMDVITLSLPVDEIGSQVAKVFVAIAVFFTYGLQFYVCLEIFWNGIKEKVQHRPLFYNYLLRTALVTATIAIAVANPNILPFLSIIGALFFSVLGLLLPMFIESVVFWKEDKFGYCYWRLYKNSIIFVFGILAVVFGTHSGIKGVLKTYEVPSIMISNITSSSALTNTTEIIASNAIRS